MSANKETGCIPLYHFWQPRFWPLWIGIGVLRLMVMLPFRLQLRIGRLLGRLLFIAMPDRRRIAAINLRICFPQLNDAALSSLLRAHSESLGISIFDIGLSMWASSARIRRLVTLEGLDNLKKPLEQGHGVIMLSGHFTAIELVGRLIAANVPDIGAMYRPLKNPLMDQLLRHARAKSISPLIPKDGVRQMIRLLRKGAPVWYASDQSYDRTGAELVPFFGEPAMTNIALTNLARVGKACVVPFFPYRLADGSGYKGIFLPALENFPSDDPVADAERVNLLLEEFIRTAPEQYYWVHRRFKNRPEPWVDVYRDV